MFAMFATGQPNLKGERMNLVQWTTLLAAVTIAMPVHAQDRANEAQLLAGPFSVTSRVIVIYRTSGVRDDGGAFNTGVATSFHCTNLSSQNELLTILVRKFDGSIVANAQFTLSPDRTWTASTHGTVAFNEDAFLSQGTI